MIISIRDEILKSTGMPLEEAAVKAGVEWVELKLEREGTIYSPQGDIIPMREGLKQWRDSRIKVFGILLSNRFAQAGEEEKRYILSAVELAEGVGAQVIRLDPLTSEEEAIETKQKIISFLREFLSSLQTDIKFGLENHGIMGNNPDFLKEIVQSVADDRLGYTIDTANFYWAGKPLSEVYRIIEELASRTFHVHAKNIAYPPELREKVRPAGYKYSQYSAPIYAGDIDMKKVVKILRSKGYKGDLCIENEALFKWKEEDRINILRQEVNYLKDILQYLH